MKKFNCIRCGIFLHAANWYHDAQICIGCGQNVPFDECGADANKTYKEIQASARKEKLAKIIANG